MVRAVFAVARAERQPGPGNHSCGNAKPCYPMAMADGDPNEIDRIERALARIERAVTANRQANEALARRHATLKARMAEALTALDEVIAREGNG
jgi:hypothetical protein